MNGIWSDPAAAWWAKAARALKHVQDVSSLAAAFEQVSPYEIRRETTGRPGEAGYSFHELWAAPPELLTTIGDALHNMRSCLDSVTFELARQHVGGKMTERQQRAAQFPICVDRATFDEFFDDNRHRRELFGPRERDAIRCVQPFAIREEAAALGVDWITSPEEEFRYDQLSRLGVLSNIDKHRRLPLLAWYLDLVYWPADDSDVTWAPARPLRTAVENESMIGVMAHQSGDDRLIPEPVIEVNLALADDPGGPHDLAGTLERWHSYLVSWVLPRIFAVADGNPPPVLIIGGVGYAAGWNFPEGKTSAGR